MNDILKILGIIIGPLLTVLGLQKFFVEPFFEARNVKKKYATALYFACEELRLHLSEIKEIFDKN